MGVFTRSVSTPIKRHSLTSATPPHLDLNLDTDDKFDIFGDSALSALPRAQLSKDEKERRIIRRSSLLDPGSYSPILMQEGMAAVEKNWIDRRPDGLAEWPDLKDAWTSASSKGSAHTGDELESQATEIAHSVAVVDVQPEKKEDMVLEKKESLTDLEKHDEVEVESLQQSQLKEPQQMKQQIPQKLQQQQHTNHRHQQQQQQQELQEKKKGKWYFCFCF